MNELLYIDGQMMDLGDKVDVTLSYKSNMLTDLSKIVGNNSYTINLPKTKRNLAAIGCADMPGVVSSFPRSYHEARYFRNGVEVIKNGKAVLMGVGTSIEIVLVWGGASALSKIVEDSKMLTEMGGFTDFFDWDSLTSASVYNGTDEIIVPDLVLNNKGGIPLHPAVRSTYIFNAIKRYYGLSMSFPSGREAFINSLIFPLLTRNGGYANRISNQGGFKDHESYGGELLDKMGSDFDSIFEVSYNGGSIRYYKVIQDCKVVVTPNFGSYYIGAYVAYGSDNKTDNIVYLPYDIKKNEDSTAFPNIYMYTTPVEIELKKNDLFLVRLMYPIVANQKGYLYTFGAQPSEVKVGDKFPIVENLPEIKIIDFIKAVASMAGLFVVPSLDGDTLTFVPFEVFRERGNAVDWSDKLIPNTEANTPANVGYSLDGFARNNRMLYKEDDTVATWADGNIVVGDATLDFERDAVKLPFAPSDSYGSRATIPLYKYDDEGVAELLDVEPRVLLESNLNGYSSGVFNGLHWSELITNYYQAYQDAVKSPVVITERIRLDELSLRDLNLAVPVYLRQYGKYYAIVEVNAPSSGICEVKLLQLD